MRVGVIGAGSFGTALSKLLQEGGHDVRLWARSSEQAAAIRSRRENERYLPGIRLPERLTTTGDLEEAVRDAELVLTVVPSHGMRDVMGRAASFLASDVVVVSASKGIENDTLMTMSEVLAEVLPTPAARRTAYLSGPSFAREVAQGLPTAVSLACADDGLGRDVQGVFAGDRFRVYTTDDVVGVELGGALKNVMAIAAGAGDGLGLGANTRAALITRGLAEISRLAVKKGANPLTLAGLAGAGDLILTCTGDLSRNRFVGVELGRGRDIGSVLDGMVMVAEGVRTTRSARDLARRLDVEMPITEQVYGLLYEGKDAREAVGALMRRSPRTEQG